MKNKKEEQQKKVNEAMKLLDKRIKGFVQSGKIKEYLDFLACFHTYSFNNVMMIQMQKPDATLVMGYKAWETTDSKKQWVRHVKKGEKGIRILAPYEFTVTKEVLNEKGESVKEKVKVTSFRIVYVFDLSQTEGDPIPRPAEEIRGSSEKAETIYQSLCELIPVPIHEGDTGQANGYYDLIKDEIWVSATLETHHKLKTLIHEYAHSLLHRVGAEYEKETRNVKEAQAESIAYVVMKYFGIDTSSYSFAYVGIWSKLDVEIIKKVGQEVQKTAARIIDEVESVLMKVAVSF